jgi:phage shock protein C
MAGRLYKSRTDRMWSGVSGGLAEYLDIDSTFVRIAWLVVGILTAGFAIIAYVALVIIMPERPKEAATESSESAAEPARSGEATADRGRGRQRNVVLGAVLVAIGGLFLAQNFDLFDWFDFGRFWPVVLILLGLLLIVRKIGGPNRDG